MQIDVQPLADKTLTQIDITERAGTATLDWLIYTARLPDRLADRQRKLLGEVDLPIRQIRHIDAGDSAGPGNCVIAEVISDSHTTVFSAFGQRGKHSNKVIAELVELTSHFIDSSAAVDRFLADQLLLYVALAGGGRFTTDAISNHCRTNMEVIKAFLPVEFSIRQLARAWEITCTRYRRQPGP